MAAHARVRTRPAPRHPRRVSGPVARPVPAVAPPVRRGGTGVFERIRALPETRVVDGLLRGRAWIWLIGLLLGGIVAMQVSLLKLNAGISNAVTTSSTLERQNADLETEIAKLSSIERVRDAATADDMVTPAPGAVGFLRARGDRDATLATRRMAPPSDSAQAIMDNSGREPGILAAAQPATTDPIAVQTPDPAGTVTPEAVATPVPTATPTPPPAAATNGATVAPQG
jgi:hypothetical protein